MHSPSRIARLFIAGTALLLTASARTTTRTSTATITTASTADVRVNGWYPCGFSTEDSTYAYAEEFEQATMFECAELEVPLCYQGICTSNKVIDIFVKRLLAETAPASGKQKAMILAQGGPGGSGAGMEGEINTMRKLTDGTVDFYTFDHRGTGRSAFLNCDAAQALTSGSPDGATMSTSELAACMKDLNFQFDGQAAAFSVTSAALDVQTIVEVFLADHDVTVMGYSYGTFLVQRVMQLQIAQVTGYIFDSVDALSVPTDPIETANSHWNEAIQAPSRRLLEYCFADEACPAEFDSASTVVEETLALYAALDGNVTNNACAKVLATYGDYDTPSYSLRQALNGLVSVGEFQQAMKMLANVQLCTAADVKALEAAFNPPEMIVERKRKHRPVRRAGSRKLASGPDYIEDDSPLLYDVVVTSERWSQPSPTLDENDAFYLDGVFSNDLDDMIPVYCVMTGSQDSACLEIQDELPKETIEQNADTTFTYAHDSYFDASLELPDHASALIFGGGLDMATPLEFAELLYSKVRGTGRGAMLVTFDYGQHCLGEATSLDMSQTCYYAMINDFVASKNTVAKIDTSCMKTLPELVLGGM